MPCNHKFKAELTLDRLNFKPTTLIVGTFNPEWPVENSAEWFYGRTYNNYFWEVLPQLFEEPSLTKRGPSDWKLFCGRHQIAITDLISSIQDADPNNLEHVRLLKEYSDKAIATHFKAHDFVDIEALLMRFPDITNVYLTRGTSDAFWNKLWQPVKNYCEPRGILVRNLLTPSKNARFQKEKGNKIDLPTFILERWKEAWNF